MVPKIFAVVNAQYFHVTLSLADCARQCMVAAQISVAVQVVASSICRKVRTPSPRLATLCGEKSGWFRFQTRAGERAERAEGVKSEGKSEDANEMLIVEIWEAAQRPRAVA
jgi:hypothetical protein